MKSYFGGQEAYYLDKITVIDCGYPSVLFSSNKVFVLLNTKQRQYGLPSTSAHLRSACVTFNLL